jgi:uncharacterized protein (DUF305 family)
MNSTHTATAEPSATEFDQGYIDMMIPHHRALIGLGSRGCNRWRKR